MVLTYLPLYRVESSPRMVSYGAAPNTLQQLTLSLHSWISLKYPMRRDLRAKLAKLYFELSGELLSLYSECCMR